MGNARISLTTYPHMTDVTVRRLAVPNAPDLFVIDFWLVDRTLFSVELTKHDADDLAYALSQAVKDPA